MSIFTKIILLNMKKTLLIVVLFVSIGCYAQGEANIWYFGNKAGLDFNSGAPVVLTDGQLNTFEGCATISNAAGQLLFYTDGVTVWNKNHQIMPNGTGLLGDPSSTQAAIIVPKPNNPNIYYVFTVTELAHVEGVRYSELDLSLNGGLGDITSNKNKLLLTPTCEKITAVKNANGDGYWVVIHGYGNNSFLAYNITAAGLNTTPIISNIGTSIVENIGFTAGYLKFSPDGNKLISCNNFVNVELFDFDTATGIISNPKLVLSSNDFSTYGVEFSSSGNIAYVTYGGYYTNLKLMQFDLTASNIPDTATLIYDGTSNSDYLGALQMASDGKIYGVIYLKNNLVAINNPDVLGTGCNFVLKAVSLGAASYCNYGLPPFITSYFNVGINFKNNCLRDTTSFSLSGNQTITAATWNFGDGNTSNAISPTHVYTTAGTYTISVKVTSLTGTSTKTRDIVIATVPTATQPQNLLICDNNNDGVYNFDLTSQNTAILNGQDSSLYTITYFANATDYANDIAISEPSNYINIAAFQQQTIIAEVSNKVNTDCKSSTSFVIDVFDKPLVSLPANNPKLILCDNTSVGTDMDGRVVFDLTQRAIAILNGQSATQFLLSYYKDEALTQSITSPTTYHNTNSTETIYVKMMNADNVNCFAITSFIIKVLSLSVITSVVDLKQCDDNVDGFSVFNLEEAINKITVNAATETITFFRTLAEAQNNVNPITNTTIYTNQVVSNDKVYVRVTNNNDCFKIGILNLIVSTTQIPSNFTRTFTQCDDAVYGSNTDGIASFDFSSVTGQIQNLFPIGQLSNITYYRNLTDALAEKNSISNIVNFRNIGYPNTQNIYVRVDSRLNNDCLGLGSYITLKVESIPIIKPLIQTHCDDDQDRLYAFDTSGIQSKLLNGLTNVSVTYFDQNNNPLPSPLPNPFTTASQTVKVVTTSKTPTSCFYDSSVQFIVDDLPEAFAVTTTLTTMCDDEADPSLQDGIYAFDTSTFHSTILGGQMGMIANYFDGNNKPLSSPLPNPFVTATQNVRVEIFNHINITCNATVILPFVVTPLPNISLLGDELVCSNQPTFTKVLNAGLPDNYPTSNYNYIWSFNGTPISDQTNYTLTVNKAGIYTVAVSNSLGCARTRTITVSASDIAKITDINIVDLAESNSITVSVTGAGDYMYSLDEEYGDYQTANIFTNVPAGIHTVFVKDLNGCGVVPKEIAVLGIPNYFTPNEDGINDYWNIKGVNASFNAKTIISIFDRYGKLIRQISPLNQGWDGTFIGQQMPASDYWYSMQLEDGRIIKGHFTLKR